MSSRKKTTTAPIYREDVAHVHVDGYSFHWEGAAASVLQWLAEYGIDDGLVVDLGCGGGEWLARLAAKGYRTCGIDVSPNMIRLAKQTAPTAKLICGSFADVEIPNCDAVTSLGEPLNYLNSATLMRRTIRKVFASLRDGGVFIFDVRHPPTRKVNPIDHVRCEQEWLCYARIVEDPSQLTRHITTFRRVGKDRYRRDEETHRLKLFSQAQVSNWLRATGFRVRNRRAYGTYRLKARQSIFICRKPRA